MLIVGKEEEKEEEGKRRGGKEEGEGEIHARTCIKQNYFLSLEGI